MAALVFGENEAAVQRTRAVFGERGSLSLDTRVGSQEVLSRALRDWVDSQEADLLCFVRAGIEPRQGDPLVDLRRFFARAAVQAAGAALLAAGDEVCPPVYTKPFRERSGTPGLHRRLGASNHCLAVMDQVTARLAGDCVVVRRAAFGDLCDFSGEAFELRATIDGPCEMIWTPHTAVGEQAQPTAP